ncbi:MAG: 30S ribosomal protein S13 [Fimbriimonadales bacterium]
MARIAGVDLPRDKKIEYALPHLYGVGLTTARMLLDTVGVDRNTRVRDLSDREIAAIREAIDRLVKVEGDLRREVQQNIRRLIEIGSYRGVRHRRGLPTRGQRTRSNARTRKGPKRTIAGKKKARK